MRKPLTPALIAKADAIFTRDGVRREEFDVRAPDGVMLRGWKVRAQTPNGNWVLLFHGIVDNRAEMASFADFLLRDGYGVVMMDAREQGASDGTLATFGWKERWDTKAVIDALYASEEPRNVFELGESMGAAIALQSAAVDPRIQAVVAEASFSSLRNVSYDYAGLDVSPLLGETLFWPATYSRCARRKNKAAFAWMMFRPSEPSPSGPLRCCSSAAHEIERSLAVIPKKFIARPPARNSYGSFPEPVILWRLALNPPSFAAACSPFLPATGSKNRFKNGQPFAALDTCGGANYKRRVQEDARDSAPEGHT